MTRYPLYVLSDFDGGPAVAATPTAGVAVDMALARLGLVGPSRPSDKEVKRFIRLLKEDLRTCVQGPAGTSVWIDGFPHGTLDGVAY